MTAQSTASSRSESVLGLPIDPVGYVAILAALATAIVHLLLGPRVMGIDQTLGTLFILNGLGFLGGVALYLTRYWRRELYLVAAGYAVLTVIAFFASQGVSVDAFYMQGSLNRMAVGAKAAELVVAVCTVYLYVDTDS